MKNKLETSKAKITEKYDDNYWYNHPYFLKKDEEARKAIAKIGLPIELVKIQQERMKK